MNDRDCESCKKFSRVDPHESEGYCDAKRTWVDPQEGEDCKMHEFTLHSANKYKDGTPIYAEPSGLTIGALLDVLVKDRDAEWISVKDALPDALQNVLVCTNINTVTVAWINGDGWTFADTGNGHTENWSFEDVKFWMPLPEPPKKLSNQLDSYEVRKGETTELSNQLDSLEQRVDELSEEYDAVLKTHGDTLEKHKERITNNEGDTNAISHDVEDLQTEFAAMYKFINAHGDMLDEHLDRICNLEHLYEQLISKLCAIEQHNGSDFCGNCTHSKLKDGIFICELSDEAIDPDSASCSMFEPPF